MTIIMVIGLIIIALVAGLSLMAYRSWSINHSELQQEFIQGTLPQVLPDGFYQGTVYSIKSDWQGKRFDSSLAGGINIFGTGKGQVESFAFKMYFGQGIHDPKLGVIKVDYSQLKDPWWVKYVLDEIVETAPKHYLGKITIQVIPGWPIAIGWFRLEQS